MTQNVNTAVMDDPFDAATNAKLRPREYYGQLAVDAYFAKLVKGTGKVPWDPQADSVDNRVTAVNISLIPLPACGLSFKLERSMIAESVEWAKIVWPSLRAQGVQSAKLADGIWVKLVQEPTGRKYRVKDLDGKPGEEREASTFKILVVYPDEAACEAAYQATQGSDDGPAAAASTQPAADPRAKETAKQFIIALAKQHHGNMDAVKRAVAMIPMITAAYDPESTEFAEIVMENVA